MKDKHLPLYDKISYDAAILAREKGFDKYSEDYYVNGIGTFGTSISGMMNDDTITKTYPQAEVQKWLREVHNIYVLLDETQTFAVTTGIGFYYKIIKVDTETKEHSMLSYSEYFYKTYEEALEEGIKNGLKLINND